MKINKIFLLWMALLPFSTAIADEIPTINPTAVFINSDGNEEESTNFSGSAPLRGVFRANASGIGAYSANYEWRFTMEGDESPYLIR